MSTELNTFKAGVKEMMAQEMPVDEAGLKSAWQTVGDENNIDVKAEDIYNPFWRVISSLVTKPVLWLINFIIDSVMPNLYLKYATGNSLKDIAWGMYVEKQSKSKAQIMVNFVRVDGADTLDVAAGTDVHSAKINGVTYKLKTMAAGRFEIGDLDLNILCEAEEPGAAYNLGTGYYQVLPKSVSGVVSVSNQSGSIVVFGTDDETDDEFRLRARNQWSNQFNWHVDAVYKSIVAGFNGVDDDNIWFDRSAPRGENSADILLLFDVGQPSQDFIDNINNEIQTQELQGLGDDVLVKTMAIINQDIVCHYSPQGGLSETQQSQLETDIQNFIGAAFRDNAGVGWTVTRTKPYDVFSFGLLTTELFNQFAGKIKNLRFDNPDIASALSVPGINTLVVNKV